MLDQSLSTATHTFRFIAVNNCDDVLSLVWMECAGDAAAGAIAEALVTEDYGIEVWDTGRLVTKLKKRAN